MSFENYPPSLQPLLDLTSSDIEQVNAVILASVKQSVPLITDIAHHIVRSGGKRLRPCLTIACAKLLRYEGERHINLAASVELIHTATLLHDDVVDESTMRRGIETANNIWSNQASVLVGDFLLSRAFQLMVADENLAVLKLLSDASATISQGEVKQLVASGDVKTSRETYFEIIHAKTAVLFAAACEIAPIIAGAPDLRPYFAQFGTHLGIAFQLIDDALDYCANVEDLGKNIGDDLREGKMTLPVIIAYESGDAMEKSFWQRTIEEGVATDADLEQATTLIAKYNTIAQTMDYAREHLEQALIALNTINGEANATEALQSTLAFCLSRRN
jgi:octaprenyl-diphosphate synthase